MNTSSQKAVNKLAWNTEITQRMRLRPMLGLGVLPIGLMFASFGVLYLAMEPLSQALGVTVDQPVREQDNGIVWMLSFLVLLFGLMISGYRIGWALNALGLRLLLSWPAEQVRRAMLYSELPDAWLRVPSPTAAGSPWAATRRQGKWRFVLQRGVLAWGIPMFLIIGVSGYFKRPPDSGVVYFFWQACLWATGGLIFGLLMWHSSERSFQKQENNTNSNPQEDAS